MMRPGAVQRRGSIPWEAYCATTIFPENTILDPSLFKSMSARGLTGRGACGWPGRECAERAGVVEARADGAAAAV